MSNNLKLPDNKTCGDCFHSLRCKTLFDGNDSNTSCQFSPNRYHPRNPKTLEELETERMEWSLKTFPDATPISSLIKAEEEGKEIEEALLLYQAGEITKEELAEEYVDRIKCDFDSAGRAGIPIAMLRDVFEKKLAKNKARTWNKNPDNTYSHVK